MAQTWYLQLWDIMSLRGFPVTWEIFKEDFLDRLFPSEMREEKVTALINFGKEGKVFMTTFGIC